MSPDVLKTSAKAQQPSTKIFKIPAYTLLYYKTGDAVLEKQVVAQISTSARQSAQREDASLVVKSQMQGQLVLQRIQIEEQWGLSALAGAKSGPAWSGKGLQGRQEQKVPEGNRLDKTEKGSPCMVDPDHAGQTGWFLPRATGPVGTGRVLPE
jgi:hypothetical protein